MPPRKRPYFVEGKLTYLRGIKEEDYELISDSINDSEFNQLLYQGWKPVDPKDIENQFENEKREENAIIFSQCEKKTDKMVGWCGLYSWEKIAQMGELRNFVHRKFWRKGFGTEQYAMLVYLGFERYNFNRIYFGTNENNKGTLKIYKKLGFTKEGVSRQMYFRQKYWDIHNYSVLRKEYENYSKEKCRAFLGNF